MEDVVILSAARTPIGSFRGQLSTRSASDLGAIAIAAALESANMPHGDVQEVLMGNCLLAGQGQAPARQAALKAGLPPSAGAVTLSKMCGSGMRTIMSASDSVKAGTADVLVAGGMESMSKAPFLLLGGRRGLSVGTHDLVDHMMLDGLEDAFAPGVSMGMIAERCAGSLSITREAQDEFALRSVERAKLAEKGGAFLQEIAPVVIGEAAADQQVIHDEGPGRLDPSKIPHLRPAFHHEGTITAASSSSIADGAAALVLASRTHAERNGLAPVARIVGQATHALAPIDFPIAPVGAIERLLERVGWAVEEVDLWEINEAFAVVPLIAMDHFRIDHARLNVNGGACALGHPIGASGARIVVTLMHALLARGARRGVAAVCIGGGEATAIAMEICES